MCCIVVTLLLARASLTLAYTSLRDRASDPVLLTHVVSRLLLSITKANGKFYL